MYEPHVSVILSTSSPKEVNFTITLFEVKDFILFPCQLGPDGSILDQLNRNQEINADESYTTDCNFTTTTATNKFVVAHSPVFKYIDLRGQDRPICFLPAARRAQQVI